MEVTWSLDVEPPRAEQCSMTGEAIPPEVFISWSGERARRVARLLVDFVESVTNAKCFLSDRDVESGAWWLELVRDGLASAKFGIVVLTPENREAP